MVEAQLHRTHLLLMVVVVEEQQLLEDQVKVVVLA
jgi:hypothetical protein